MAVFDHLWWSAGRGWAVVWVVTALLLLVVALWPLGRLLSRRGGDRQPAGIAFFLDGQRVMDLYEMGPYRQALKRRVQEETSRGFGAGIRAALAGIGINLGARVDRRVVQTYVEVAEPIRVVRTVLSVIAKDTVTADLYTGSVESGTGLKRVFNRLGVDGRTSVSPTDLLKADSYVSIRGGFRVVARAGDVITFEAEIAPADGNPATVVRCEYHRSGLRLDVPDREFPARCLGKISGWDADTGTVTVFPVIAIFQ
ncbi:hypothetical protein ACIA8K_13655 [Catenuloplanes sp. NPDC051500]|uniref:hypothetical protein n=1 Tax=Catenuloplanes sp. NPDC051500 TaxID=3363959 RepID=UPI0037B84F57